MAARQAFGRGEPGLVSDMQMLGSSLLSALASSAKRILLLNAPAVDVRLPWARWQQPVGLLQIGAALRGMGCDVRLLDCLQVPAEGRLARERVGRLDIEGGAIDLWRFGLSPARVVARLRAWALDGWQPDRVLVSGGLGTWWQGARDLIMAVKREMSAPVILGGAYATFYPEHAADHTGADAIVVGNLLEAQCLTADLTLYEPAPIPRFAGIHLLRPAGLLPSASTPRAPQAVAEEVKAKAELGVTSFAFFDDWLGPGHREPLAEALAAIAALDLRQVGFVAVGNFSPRLIDGDLARLLRQARFRHVHLHDDVAYTSSGAHHLSAEGDYARCVQALHNAGFRPRTDEVGAGVLVGIPGEDLSAVAERLVRLASIVGSVNLVPYQYTPGTPQGKPFERLLAQRNGCLDLTTLNAQLYPLARLCGATMEHYRELTRLAALLNAKYRSRTFDFLGNSLTARMVHACLGERLWDPFHRLPDARPDSEFPQGSARAGSSSSRQESLAPIKHCGERG